MEGEKFLGMPAKYKPFVIAGGLGVVVFLLFGRRGAGSAMPSAGFTPIGTAGPAPDWLDTTEEHAAEHAERDITGRGLLRQLRLSTFNDPNDFPPDWHARKGAQLEAEHEARLNQFRPGKKAHSSSNWLKDVAQGLIRGAVSAYAGGSPVTLGTSAEYAFFGGSDKKRKQKPLTTFEGPWAPERYQKNAMVIWDDRDIDIRKTKPQVLWGDGPTA